MHQQHVRHDCSDTSCSECPRCSVCETCKTCTDCTGCRCPSDAANELLRWLENRPDVCKNCFQTKYPTDTERGHIEGDDGHSYEEYWHSCGVGERSPAAVHREWCDESSYNLPTPPSSRMTITEVLDRVLARFEDLYLPVDREAAFSEGARKKADDEVWSNRDRDVILFALDAAMDIDTVLDELGWDGLDRVADRSY